MAIIILSALAFAGPVSAPFASHGTASAQTVADDKAALTALYNATDGANWTYKRDWLSDEPLSDWYGVQTDANGRVTGLLLYENNLTGSIPAEVGNLSNLRWMLLYDNRLSGSIPPELGNLSNLESLYLHYNQLSGSIPSQLGNLSDLKVMGLSYNQLSGSVPTQLGNLSSLRGLLLNDNKLSGSIPSQLSDLSNLESLWLKHNQLSGSVPTELGNLSNLESLYLHDNKLSGTLPQSLTNLTTLDTFTFSWTGLCAPSNAAFQSWLRGLPNNLISSGNPFGPNCAGSTPTPEPVPPPTPTVTPTPSPTPEPIPNPGDELLAAYDDNENGRIDDVELGNAIFDYVNGDLSPDDMGTLILLWLG